MSKAQVMEKALMNLVFRLKQGEEFPDAVWAVTDRHKVNYEELADAYDEYEAAADLSKLRDSWLISIKSH